MMTNIEVLVILSVSIMIAALGRLKVSAQQPHLPEQTAAFGISGGIRHDLKWFFMSHPSSEERTAALQRQASLTVKGERWPRLSAHRQGECLQDFAGVAILNEGHHTKVVGNPAFR